MSCVEKCDRVLLGRSSDPREMDLDRGPGSGRPAELATHRGARALRPARDQAFDRYVRESLLDLGTHRRDAEAADLGLPPRLAVLADRDRAEDDAAGPESPPVLD